MIDPRRNALRLLWLRLLWNIRHPCHIFHGRSRFLGANKNRIVLAGLLDALATISYCEGVRLASVSIVATLATLQTVMAIGLARWRLREALARTQWRGIACIIIGILLVSAFHR